jgi:hypothetical protein
LELTRHRLKTYSDDEPLAPRWLVMAITEPLGCVCMNSAAVSTSRAVRLLYPTQKVAARRGASSAQRWIWVITLAIVAVWFVAGFYPLVL